MDVRTVQNCFAISDVAYCWLRGHMHICVTLIIEKLSGEGVTGVLYSQWSLNAVINRSLGLVQGRSDGGGISVYIPPKSVYLTNFYVVTGCFCSL